MGNSKSPLPEGFDYYDEVLNARAIRDEYLARHEKLRDSENPNDRYSAYMCGRRAGLYAYNAGVQGVNLHEVALGLGNNRVVCTCGLIYEGDTEQPAVLPLKPGHLFGRELTTLLICELTEPTSEVHSLHLYCQICAQSWPVIWKSESDPDDLRYVDIDLAATMAQHEHHSK